MPPGKKASSGRFRAYLRLGAAPPPRPDHVVVVLDRSRSTAPDLHRDAFAATARALYSTAPSSTTPWPVAAGTNSRAASEALERGDPALPPSAGLRRACVPTPNEAARATARKMRRSSRSRLPP